MEKKKTFKARYIVIPLLAAALIFMGYMGILPFPGAFRYQMLFSLGHFGSERSELYTVQSPAETKLGLDIVGLAKKCMEYDGDEDSAPPAGALSKYYYFPAHRKPAETEVSVDLVKSVINGDEGSVWFYYSLAHRGEDGELISRHPRAYGQAPPPATGR